jgi:hypothetical protein
MNASATAGDVQTSACPGPIQQRSSATAALMLRTNLGSGRIVDDETVVRPRNQQRADRLD